jgi:hypothetical protein
MVRSVSTETNDSESSISPLKYIFNEFYPENSVKSLVKPHRVYLTLMNLIEKYIKNQKVERVNATNRFKTINQVLLSFSHLKYQEFLASPGKKKGFSHFVASEDFSKVFFIFCKYLFSRTVEVLIKKLKIRCCTSSKHFAFCKSKWCSLERFCIQNFPLHFNREPVTCIYIQDIVSEVLLPN